MLLFIVRCQNAIYHTPVLSCMWGITQFCVLQWAAWRWHHSFPTTSWMVQKWLLTRLLVIKIIFSSFSSSQWLGDPGASGSKRYRSTQSLSTLCDSWIRQSRSWINRYSVTCWMLRKVTLLCILILIIGVYHRVPSWSLDRTCIGLYLLYKKPCNLKRFISSSVSSVNSIQGKSVKTQTSQVTGWKLHVISKRWNLKNMLLFYQCLFIYDISHRIITMNIFLELWGVKGL